MTRGLQGKNSTETKPFKPCSRELMVARAEVARKTILCPRLINYDLRLLSGALDWERAAPCSGFF